MHQATALPKPYQNKHTGDSKEYDLVAKEYYDAHAHPTCANLNELSRKFIYQKLSGRSFGHVLELGCGLSSVAPLRKDNTLSTERLVISDHSESMLSWSSRFDDVVDEAIVADNEYLMELFGENEFDLIVCSLGDPYNTEMFWKGLQGVCKNGAEILFTTPSYKWASIFREKENTPSDRAYFRTTSDSDVYVKSHILDAFSQMDLIRSSGLRPVGCELFYIDDLTSGVISPKLLLSSDAATEVVIGYHVDKAD